MKSFLFSKIKENKVNTLSLQKLAEDGNSEAQYKLGFKLYTNHDYTAAFDWFMKASESGHGASQNQLGLAYQNGLGIPQDDQHAVEWFTESATVNNNPDAQFNLGSFYYYGRCGIAQDYNMAYQWFLKASENGNHHAQNSIGFLYQRGWGVQQDHHLALKWFQKAALSHNANAQNQIGVFYKKGYGVKTNHRTAFEWYAKSAKNGSTAGQCNLAWMYYDGTGTRQDYNKAITWFLKAAERGSVDSQYQIGVMYFNGYGVEKSDKVALEYLYMALRNGSPVAQNYIDLVSSSVDNEKTQVTDRPPSVPVHHRNSSLGLNSFSVRKKSGSSSMHNNSSNSNISVPFYGSKSATTSISDVGNLNGAYAFK